LKVRYTGETSSRGLTHGETYEVMSIEYGSYRIIDNTDEDYLYPDYAFEIVESEPAAPVLRL